VNFLYNINNNYKKFKNQESFLKIKESIIRDEMYETIRKEEKSGRRRDEETGNFLDM